MRKTSVLASYRGIAVLNIGMNAIICIELIKFQPEVMSPVSMLSAKAELTVAVVDETLASSSLSAS